MGIMDKAYVVMEYDVEDRWIRRIYETREEAEAYLARAVLDPHQEYEIEEWPVGDGGYYEGDVWYVEWITCLDDGGQHHANFVKADWPGHLESRKVWPEHFDGQIPPDAAPHYLQSDPERGWYMVRWYGLDKGAVERGVEAAVTAIKASLSQ